MTNRTGLGPTAGIAPVLGEVRHCAGGGGSGVCERGVAMRLPDVSMVDELVVCKAQGDRVCEVWPIAVINNPDRPASTSEPSLLYITLRAAA